MKIFCAILTNLTVLLPQSRDRSCYVILASPPLWLHKHTDLRAFTDLWHQPRLADITRARSWRLCGIKPAIATDKAVLHNVNSKDALVGTMTSYVGVEVWFHTLITSRTKWISAANFTLLPLYPRKKKSRCTQWVWGWMDLRAGLNAVLPLPGIETGFSGRPGRNQATVSTEL